MTLAASPGLDASPYDDDRRLVARCRAGERDACEDLYRRHAPRVLGLARRMVGPTDDAEDAAQDVFLAVFRKLDSFRGESSLATWLYRLAMNVCLDRLRSRGHRERKVTDEFDADDASHVAAPAPVGRLSPGAAIDLERAIAALPQAARAAFLLHDVEGFDHREVGTILGIAEGTSKSQVHKARMRIRTFLHQTRTAATRATHGR
ncbi:MAG: RNA polymerase sigma factor [Vicinamibacteraceae bacterium]